MTFLSIIIIYVVGDTCRVYIKTTLPSIKLLLSRFYYRSPSCLSVCPGVILQVNFELVLINRTGYYYCLITQRLQYTVWCTYLYELLWTNYLLRDLFLNDSYLFTLYFNNTRSYCKRFTFFVLTHTNIWIAIKKQIIITRFFWTIRTRLGEIMLFLFLARFKNVVY